jgi:hypothetical protein
MMWWRRRKTSRLLPPLPDSPRIITTSRALTKEELEVFRERWNEQTAQPAKRSLVRSWYK